MRPVPPDPDRSLRLILRTLAVALVAVLAVVLLSLPAAAHHDADPAAPRDFRNADPSTFGQVRIPAYTQDVEGPVALQVPLTLHPERLGQAAERYLVGFNLHADAVRIDDLALTSGGRPVPIERDDSDRALQPRFIIAGDALPRDRPVDLVLTGTATAGRDGQLHVGVLAIAFDGQWRTLRTTDGASAEAYGFTLLMAQGNGGTFAGSGHSILPWLAVAGLLATTAGGLVPVWRPDGLFPRKARAPTAPPPARPPPRMSAPRPALLPVPASRPAVRSGAPSVPLRTQAAPTLAARPTLEWAAARPKPAGPGATAVKRVPAPAAAAAAQPAARLPPGPAAVTAARPAPAARPLHSVPARPPATTARAVPAARAGLASATTTVRASKPASRPRATAPSKRSK